MGDIQRIEAGKVFITRLKQFHHQQFRDHLHLPFANIPPHLENMVIQGMEFDGEGWLVKMEKLKLS